MKIKKFTAPTLQEGKILIKKELGEEAVVLSTRTVRNAADNEEIVEIVAAVDDNVQRFGKNRLRLPERTIAPKAGAEKDAGTENFLENSSHIYNELAGLKDMLNELNDNVRFRYSGSLGPEFGRLYKELLKSDISEEYALDLIGRISAEKMNMEFPEAYKRARNLLTMNINIQPPVKKTDKRKIAAFIGPTGCGKTTTLVKLGIIGRLILEADVLLVSADLFKVGGNDQLQSIASIAGIPFKEVNSPSELKSLLNEEKGRDMILIDTTGISYKNKANMKSLEEITRAASCDFLYLTLSCSTSLKTLIESIGEFGKLNPNALIFTKTDEAASMGAVIESLRKVSIPVAYFATGQKIPDDIEPASREYFSEIVLPELNV